jgi:hypothetical protein
VSHRVHRSRPGRGRRCPADVGHQPGGGRRYNNAEATDITLVACGLNKTLHRMLDAAGADLHRQGFLAASRSGREFASYVFPPLRFGTGHPFGATQAHLLEADCTQRRFKTSATFVSSF